MKRLAVLFLALAAAAAHAETWRFALIGDTPYSDYERQELPAMIDAVAAEHVDFIVHAGDFKHSKDACSDALFEDRRQLFDASPAPFVYVPGDNEWTDCGRVSAGSFVPAERLAKLRELFFAGDESLGRRRLALERQPGDYREHQRWRLGPVLFVSLNVPGGNNNYRLTGEASDEALARMPQVLAWLREGFTLARREALAGVVVVMQANPDFRYFAAGVAPGGYRELLAALREETMNFSGQVVLVHGDTHWQRIDQPLRDPASGRRLANFTRVETFGYPHLGWVKGYIDRDSPALFRFEAQPWPRRAP
ncbi:metallophosphoesterase family protein [Azospira restricta]|uniref:Metallophosphoesterase n=1 Tax=Azospira restricta TaxID=404405 RepID=A0A974SML0_9RHOO|nr:metallophosphoesterase [Azospira restricta]QRJ62557.1 metallophosphoesterase [Azospira restricta]